MSWKSVETQKDVIEFAVSRGAKVNLKKDNVTELTGKGGGAVLLVGKDGDKVTSQTKDTLWKWFKIIGLLLVLLSVFKPDWVSGLLAILIGG